MSFWAATPAGPGVALGGKAGASAAEGNLKGEINIPIPFTDWTISGRGKVSGDAGAVGVDGGAARRRCRCCRRRPIWPEYPSR